MKARLTGINYNEVLLYLGYKGQTIDEKLSLQLEYCINDCLNNAEPRLVYKCLDVVDGEIQGLNLSGNDIKTLLKDCKMAIVAAASLGLKADKFVQTKQITDMGSAAIINCAQSSAIENVCDNFQQDIKHEYQAQGLYITDRFSPGYGDLPLETSHEILKLLDAEKRIGLVINANHMMVPKKSVTFIIGIADKEQSFRKKGCESCSMFLNCQYRRQGVSCNGQNDNT
ncbi:MAG: hypothetical protein HUK23_04020 [Sphaerochaetaceae bacterium]|nr:hypothetical protein [Sphaerochaetaceae bacterium]